MFNPAAETNSDEDWDDAGAATGATAAGSAEPIISEMPEIKLFGYAAKHFRKAQYPIVERLVNSLMMHGRNNGKKLMTVRIIKHSFEIIHLTTGDNPLQVLVSAIINSGPQEDSTVCRQAVDVSLLHRV